ncbi:MAG: L,D-transpeptidase family protein [Myxococcaceae bacterium]
MGKALALVLLFAAASPAGANGRVQRARKAKGETIAAAFKAAGVAYPPKEIFLRAFKSEKELEVWAGPKGKPLTRVKTIPFCYASGEVGPKRVRGDSQVPEGFYSIDRFNDQSSYLLALRVSYPNESDRVLGVKGHLGGDIYIHGSCVSIGCIAIEDGPIQELYLMALDARDAGASIPIAIFPRRLDDAGLAALEKEPHATPELVSFWKGLQPGYQLFERSRRPPKVSVDPKSGAYRIAPGR